MGIYIISVVFEIIIFDIRINIKFPINDPPRNDLVGGIYN